MKAGITGLRLLAILWWAAYPRGLVQ